MKSSKVGLSMESSVADFFQFSSAFTKLFYLGGRWGTGLCLQVPCRSYYFRVLRHKYFAIVALQLPIDFLHDLRLFLTT